MNASSHPSPIPLLPLLSNEIYVLPVWGEGAPRMVSMKVIAREEAALPLTLHPRRASLAPSFLRPRTPPFPQPR